MKNRFLVSMVMAIFIAGLISSCDVFDKVDDVSFSTNFQESIQITDAPEGSYSKSVTLDATTDPEVDRYKDKIKGIELNKITYKVSGYNGPSDATFSGDMLFGTNGSLGSVAISGLNLNTASSSGVETELDLSQQEVDAVANQLKSDKAVVVTMAGNFSKGPVTFLLTVKVDAKITADAL